MVIAGRATDRGPPFASRIMQERSLILTAARSVDSGETSQPERIAAKQQTDSTVPESFVGSPMFLAASLTGFALIALDVFGPSAHVLAYVDNGERLSRPLSSVCCSYKPTVCP